MTDKGTTKLVQMIRAAEVDTYSSHRGASPEHNLWLAVLERAIRDALGGDLKVVAWFLCTTSETWDRGGFQWIIHILDFENYRKAIIDIVCAAAEKHKKSRTPISDREMEIQLCLNFPKQLIRAGK